MDFLLLTSAGSGLQEQNSVERFRSYAGNDSGEGGAVGRGLMAVIEKIDWRRKVG